MPVRVTPSATRSTEPGRVEADLRLEGLEPTRWGNGPGDTYRWHSHGYGKVLVCLRGSITFHTREADDVELHPGDRLEIGPGTEHAATVGPDGVECAEARRGAG